MVKRAENLTRHGPDDGIPTTTLREGNSEVTFSNKSNEIYVNMLVHTYFKFQQGKGQGWPRLFPLR